MRSRVWFRMKVGSSQWTFVFGRLKNLEGLCQFDKCRITIAYGLNRGIVHGVAFHELKHACDYVSGADKAILAALHHNEHMSEVIEELEASTSNQALFDALSNACYLRLPEVPDWYK